MKKLALQKVVTLVAALALGSACIPNDALARGGGGSGFSGGGGGGTGGGGFGGATWAASPAVAWAVMFTPASLAVTAFATATSWVASARHSSMATTGIMPTDSTAGNRNAFPPMPPGASVRQGQDLLLIAKMQKGAAIERRFFATQTPLLQPSCCTLVVPLGSDSALDLGSHVRFGSKVDVGAPLAEVRFMPYSGRITRR